MNTIYPYPISNISADLSSTKELVSIKKEKKSGRLVYLRNFFSKLKKILAEKNVFSRIFSRISRKAKLIKSGFQKFIKNTKNRKRSLSQFLTLGGMVISVVLLTVNPAFAQGLLRPPEGQEIHVGKQFHFNQDVVNVFLQNESMVNLMAALKVLSYKEPKIEGIEINPVPVLPVLPALPLIGGDIPAVDSHLLTPKRLSLRLLQKSSSVLASAASGAASVAHSRKARIALNSLAGILNLLALSASLLDTSDFID
jgi:hypothetical protein